MGSKEENEILPMRTVDKTVLGASTKVDPMLKKLTPNNTTTLNKVVFGNKRREFFKKYEVLIKFIVRMLNGFHISNQNS